jgi:hypothetical protein
MEFNYENLYQTTNIIDKIFSKNYYFCEIGSTFEAYAFGACPESRKGIFLFCIDTKKVKLQVLCGKQVTQSQNYSQYNV